MEQVIRRRHPNSLPAMMMVAAQAPDSVLTDGLTTGGGIGVGRTVNVLENRVKKLEAELEGKDESAQQDLRAMEQKYNHVKVRLIIYHDCFPVYFILVSPFLFRIKEQNHYTYKRKLRLYGNFGWIVMWKNFKNGLLIVQNI